MLRLGSDKRYPFKNNLLFYEMSSLNDKITNEVYITQVLDQPVKEQIQRGDYNAL